MAQFAVNQTIETTEPIIAVDRLPLGRHRFQLEVIDDAGHRSRPAVAIVEVQREIVLPTGPIDLRGVARPAGEAASSSPAALRAKRGRKASPSPAKKPRRPRRKE
jgi:hypothetical protein